MLEKSQNLGRLAPASFCMSVQVYASMWIVVANPVMRQRGRTASDTRAIWPNSAHRHFYSWLLGELGLVTEKLWVRCWTIAILACCWSIMQ